MITEREVRQVAGKARLGVGQTEYEYVILCALDALSQTPLLSETFCLKGGTALRQLAYGAPVAGPLRLKKGLQELGQELGQVPD